MSLGECQMDSIAVGIDSCEHHAGVICRGMYVMGQMLSMWVIYQRNTQNNLEIFVFRSSFLVCRS